MHFVKSAAIVFITAFAVTTPVLSQCITETTSCCETVTTAGAPGIPSLLKGLGVALGDLSLPIGLGCSQVCSVHSCVYVLLAHLINHIETLHVHITIYIAS